MTNALRVTTFILIFFFAVCLASGQTQPTPPGPIPAQLFAAKKIFIANVPGTKLPDALGGTTRAYDEFYAAIKSWGQYELVSTPADADLVYEISFVSAVLGVSGTGQSGCSSSSSIDIQLVIVDPKTRVPIWWMQQDMQGAFRTKTWDKNFDSAMNALVQSLKLLANAPAPAGAKP